MQLYTSILPKQTRCNSQNALLFVLFGKYVKDIPCRNSFEEEPWQLEYTIMRVDNPGVIKSFSSDNELSDDVTVADDLEKEFLKRADSPPDSTLKGGDN